MLSWIRGRRLQRSHEGVSYFFSALEMFLALRSTFDESCFCCDCEDVGLEVEIGGICVEGAEKEMAWFSLIWPFCRG